MPTPRSVFFIAAVVYLCVSTAAGIKCYSAPVTLIADFQARSLLSPGFPMDYEINDQCTWTMTAAVSDPNFVIQIVTLDIDIDDHNKECNSDYLAVYQGEGTSGPLLAKWCGKDHKIINLTNRTVTLYFHSDAQYTGKGFALHYSLIKHTPADCVEGNTPVFEIGAAPVYESFKGAEGVKRCEWKLQSLDLDERLVIELFKPGNIPCDMAFFSFYDGAQIDSHLVFEMCSSLKPFSIMYLDSAVALLVLDSLMGEETEEITLKISTRPVFFECNEKDLPTIEVNGGPAIFSLPFASNSRGEDCPVRLCIEGSDDNFLRLDVMATSAGNVNCEMDVIGVKGTHSNSMVEKSCSRGTNPVYRHTMREGLIITNEIQSGVFLRAAAVDTKCNGGLIEETAFETLIVERSLTGEDGYSDFAFCKMLLTARKDQEIVSLSIHWKPPLTQAAYSMSTTCSGDYLNVYDGSIETDPVLYSSCRKQDRPTDSVDTTIYSTGKKLLLVFDADAKIGGEAVIIKYHSLPGGVHCTNDAKDITVGRSPQILQSPNYPNQFPLNQKCLYHLKSENPEENIVVKVLDSNLQSDCGNILMVLAGEYKDHVDGKVIGRVCGKDTPTYTIDDQSATLMALSEDESGPGGWRVQVHTEEKVVASSSRNGSMKLSIGIAYIIFVFTTLLNML